MRPPGGWAASNEKGAAMAFFGILSHVQNCAWSTLPAGRGDLGQMASGHAIPKNAGGCALSNFPYSSILEVLRKYSANSYSAYVCASKSIRRTAASQFLTAPGGETMHAKQAGKIRIGVSGWRYPPWRGVFYPAKLPQKKELNYCGQVFPTLEINGSFYSLQRPASYRLWRAETPDDFVFAVKGSRFITHMLKLRNVEIALANFFASGLLALGPKLGPILWQFPPNFSFRPEVLESFFKLLPRTIQQAADLATGHDRRLAGRAFLDVESDGPVRHAIEIRHQSFVSEEFIA